MAKFSVGGTQVISDSATIDWSLLDGAPAAASVANVNIGTITNCGHTTDFVLDITRTGHANGQVVFAFTSKNGSPSNCNCNCNCNCT